MLAELAGYDWQEVFADTQGWLESNESDYSALWHTVGFSGPEADVHETIHRSDVAEVLAMRSKDGDYAEWEGQLLARLKDGRYIFVGGWCDTTGWGCQDGTFRYVGPTFGAIARFAMGEEERRLMGVEI